MTHDTEPAAGFERILEYLRQSRGVDLAAYKPTTLMRRVRKRMDAVRIEEFDAYLDYLQVRPDEFRPLFNTILINVTSFFRDHEVWEFVRTTIVPQLAASGNGHAPIRVWSAGCASGQEAYTAAMLLADALGIDAFKTRVKIYATDIDDEALAESRRAVYTARHVADIPPEMLSRYFEHDGGDLYSFNRDLRRAVIFGRHDLIQDAPISHVHLLLCRNTLMYFNSEAQARIVARFYFSVNPNGYLVLGRAEMLSSHATLFQPIDLKHRIFRTVQKINHRDRLLLAQPGREETVAKNSNQNRLRDAAFELSADAQLVLDPMGVVVSINAAARRQFSLTEQDAGRPIQDLEVSYRPADLRGLVTRVNVDRREVTQHGVPFEQGGTTRFFNVAVVPLLDGDAAFLGTRVSFSDVTQLKSLQAELTHSKQELETAYEELETTNEELQSTVEELETTNEELQSTNEELQTMNEELQSTNEELQTMNDELRSGATESNSLNEFLHTVFASMRSGVVVLDRDLRVQIWNAGALDLWGIRAEEAVGMPFFALDIGLPIGELHQPIRDVLAGTASHRQLVLTAMNRKGRTIQCRVSVVPLMGAERTITGIILPMEEHVEGAPEI